MSNMCSDFLPFFLILQWFFPYSLIKYDVDKGEPVRDSSGFCIEASRGALKYEGARTTIHPKNKWFQLESRMIQRPVLY